MRYNVCLLYDQRISTAEAKPGTWARGHEFHKFGRGLFPHYNPVKIALIMLVLASSLRPKAIRHHGIHNNFFILSKDVKLGRIDSVIQEKRLKRFKSLRPTHVQRRTKTHSNRPSGQNVHLCLRHFNITSDWTSLASNGVHLLASSEWNITNLKATFIRSLVVG